MLYLRIINTSTRPYGEVLNDICTSLAGSRAFVENDIVVSEEDPENNVIGITLGDGASHMNTAMNLVYHGTPFFVEPIGQF